ncbi:MAG: indolepyruvate ferredoxin oxidoreductase, beta subunit [Bacillota bacterium]|nr:indolepyruvate ferredoxin oxidoreductase, beta subunit [Bacillota bacterium]
MAKVTNVLLVGVGGQGTILATRVLAGVLVEEGYDVKMSEVHGMSQRGGSVLTFVRYGDKVYSPLVERGTADLILAFEKLEAVRYLPYLKPEGTLVVNDLAILPAPVLLGKAEYPYNALDILKEKVKDLVVMDAAKLAEEKTGNVRTQNIVLLGALARRMDIPPGTWEKVVSENVPPKTVEANLKAFWAGWEGA